MKSLILEIHNKLINHEITIDQLLDQYINSINKSKLLGTFINLTYDKINLDQIKNELEKHHDNLLFAIPYALKDNIATSEFQTTGGSLLLKDFIPPYDATIYKIFKNHNAILMGKTSLDEFGLGAYGLDCYTGYTKNYYDPSRIVGGSSCGSANAVAANNCTFAIGTDTGDSVRRPAAFAGVVGYKPSYGLISRNGVYPYAPCMDHIGIITNYVADAAIVMQYICQHDENDYTSQKTNNTKFFNELKLLKQIKFATFKGIENYLTPIISDAYKSCLQQIIKAGHIVEQIEIDWNIIKAMNPAYQIITYPEANSCLANLTGITFGTNFDSNLHGYKNIIFNNRTKGFGKELKRRLSFSQYIVNLPNYEELYLQARKLRTYIINYVNQILDEYDCFIFPTISSIAPKIEDVITHKYKPTLCDDLNEIANFAGSPSISIPTGFVNNMPVGIEINTKKFNEQKLINIAYTLEGIFNFDKEKKHD